MTSSDDFANELVIAAGTGNAVDRIEAVKSAVTRQLSSGDPSVRIKHTQYFNHSFAPDMVLEWRKEKIARGVFIRPHAEARWLSQDLPLLALDRPLIYALSGIDRGSFDAGDEPLEAFQSIARATGTLIAEPQTVEAFGKARSAAPAVALLSQAVMRGGRGHVDGASASTAIATTREGFEGAANVDQTTTAAATELIGDLLDTDQSGRMTRLLQSVWEGHGGARADFPARDLIGGPLTDDDLIFLLRTLEIPGVDFWSRVARRVTAEQLARLHLEDPSLNLQDLIKALLERLEAKALRVLDADYELGESQQTPRWMISNGCIVLRGDGWKAFLAPNRQDQLPETDDWPSVTATELESRADELSLVVSDVEMRGSTASLIWEANEQRNVVHDKAFRAVVRQTGASIDRASLMLPDGNKVICDFTRRSARGQTNARFAFRDLIRYCLPFLKELDPSERRLVDSLIEEAQGRLF